MKITDPYESTGILRHSLATAQWTIAIAGGDSFLKPLGLTGARGNYVAGPRDTFLLK